MDVLLNSFVQVSQKERPPMHEYIRKLLYKDLSKTTTEKVNHNIVLYILRYIICDILGYRSLKLCLSYNVNF